MKPEYKWQRILFVIFWLTAAAQFALFAVFIYLTAVLTPFSDRIGWIGQTILLLRGGNFVEYLLAPHNEHRMAIIRLISFLDVAAFRANGVIFVVAGTTAMIAAALLIWRELYRATIDSDNRVLSLLGPMLLLSTAAAVDCSIPINIVYPVALLFMLAAVVLALESCESTRWSGVFLGMAIVSGVISSLANAIGFCVWPALIWVLWRGAAPARSLIYTITFAVIYGAIYFVPMFWDAAPHGKIPISADRIIRMAEYFVAFLGLPLSRAPQLFLISSVFGALLLVISLVVLAADFACRCLAARPRLFAGALIIISLSSAALATIGRVDSEEMIALPVRYSILVSPLHIGLLTIALAAIPRRSTARTTISPALVCGVGIGILLVALQVIGGMAAVRESAALSSALVTYERTGSISPKWAHLIPPSADKIITDLRQYLGQSDPLPIDPIKR